MRRSEAGMGWLMKSGRLMGGRSGRRGWRSKKGARASCAWGHGEDGDSQNGLDRREGVEGLG